MESLTAKIHFLCSKVALEKRSFSSLIEADCTALVILPAFLNWSCEKKNSMCKLIIIELSGYLTYYNLHEEYKELKKQPPLDLYKVLNKKKMIVVVLESNSGVREALMDPMLVIESIFLFSILFLFLQLKKKGTKHQATCVIKKQNKVNICNH